MYLSVYPFGNCCMISHIIYPRAQYGSVTVRYHIWPPYDNMIICMVATIRTHGYMVTTSFRIFRHPYNFKPLQNATKNRVNFLSNDMSPLDHASAALAIPSSVSSNDIVL